jgi:putative ABC transport system substrate-binding protein
MDRRRFLLTSLAGALAGPLAARAQQPRRIAFLCPISCSNLPHVVLAGDRAFMSGLTRAGFSGGGDLYFDMAGGVGYERLSEMALQIGKRNPDVVIAFGNAAARAARRATSTVPVVMVGVADPVEDGLIRSLGRPGGNLTGVAIPYEQLVAKQIELLKEIQPALARVAIFWNPELEVLEKRRERIETVVRSLGVKLHLLESGTRWSSRRRRGIVYLQFGSGGSSLRRAASWRTVPRWTIFIGARRRTWTGS